MNLWFDTCSVCREHRELVCVTETPPYGERRPVCAECRDEIAQRVCRWINQVDRAVRRRAVRAG